MKNLLRRFKLIFRYPRVGEIWAVDYVAMNCIETTYFTVAKAATWGYKGTFEFTSNSWDTPWIGEIHRAGPIYLVRGHNLIDKCKGNRDRNITKN